MKSAPEAQGLLSPFSRALGVCYAAACRPTHPVLARLDARGDEVRSMWPERYAAPRHTGVPVWRVRRTELRCAFRTSMYSAHLGIIAYEVAER
jgi:hypothetical protein